MADQGLLNGRLLQSAAMDCTVHCSRLYGPLQRTIQSAAGDCTVHCNGLYSPLPETVVIRRTDRHNRKDENAWYD